MDLALTLISSLSKCQRTMRSVRSIAFLAAAVVSSALCAQTAAPVPRAADADKLQPSATRRPAPAFHLVDAHGQTIDLANYRGKVVLLDFWATWCGGCKLEIPWFMAFDEKYRAQGLAAIGVAMDDEGWAKVRPFLVQPKDEETGGNTAMQYPVVLGSTSLAGAYGLTSMPMTVLIDRQGKIALSHTGVIDKAGFEQDILHLLQQP